MKDSVLLRSASGSYTAEILPARGGNCISLSHTASGVEVFRTPTSLDSFVKDNPYLYGMPILLFPNRITGGKFTFDGREYQLPINEPSTGCFIHGVLHETPLEVTDLQSDSVAMRYVATAEKPYLGCFPHPFTCTVRFDLDDGGLTQTVGVRNDSALPMPMGLAYHTTFRLPFVPGGDLKDVRLKLSVGTEFERDMRDYSMTWNTVDDFEFTNALEAGKICPFDHVISRHYRRPAGAEMQLCDIASGYRIVYTADDQFKFWMVWNGGNKEFLCIEPQTWMNNGVNAPEKMGDTGVIGIPSGETRTFVTKVCVEKA